MPVEINELVIRATVAEAARIIEVDSSKLPDDVEAHLDSATVIDRLHMPDTFVLVFHDPVRDILERAQLAIGKRVKISTGSLNSEAPDVLIDGEVTSIEADYDSMGSRAVVRGYDLSHRLNAGRNSKTYQGSTYSDIAREIAGAANLQTDIEPTQEVHEHIIQANQSDLDFLMGLAKEVDYVCRVDGETLLFKKQPPATEGPAAGSVSSTKGTELVWGTNLQEFHARISAVAQVKDVKARGFDHATKQAIIGQADVTASHAEVSTKPATLSENFGSKTLYVTNQVFNTQKAADAFAKSKAEAAGGSAYTATLVCDGSAELRAGATLSVVGVEKTLEGKWTVSTTRHVFEQGSYKTYVECTGGQDRSFSGLVANGLGIANDSMKYFGLAVGIVTGNDDPDKQGRVKLKFPWLDDQVETFWAPIAMPGAGPGYGLVWVPQVNDAVVVAFEQGDIQHPMVIGGLWNGQDAAPLGKDFTDQGKVKRSGLVSRSGHMLVCFDSDGKSGMALLSANGKFKIALNETKDELHIVSKGKLVIEAKELEIKVDSSAKIEAGGQMTIKGATVALN